MLDGLLQAIYLQLSKRQRFAQTHEMIPCELIPYLAFRREYLISMVSAEYVIETVANLGFKATEAHVMFFLLFADYGFISLVAFE